MREDTVRLHRRIGQALLSEAPRGDWAELRCGYVVAGMVSEDSAWAVMADGSRRDVLPDRDLRDAFEELRPAMHDPERGIWYTATVRVSRDLDLSIDFDDDHEPRWGLSVGVLPYAKDLELLPRQDSAIPDWLRARLAEAAAKTAAGQ